MDKKKIIRVSLVLGLLILTVISVIVKNQAPASADIQTRYQSLKSDQTNFEERAKAVGIENAEKAQETLHANKGASDKIKPIEKVKNYTKDGDLKDGAKYLDKKLLTYEEFLNKYPEFDLNPTISKDRMVYVIVTHFPKGLDTGEGIVKNAISTTLYDAETGESIAWSVKSLDGPSGNQIGLERIKKK